MAKIGQNGLSKIWRIKMSQSSLQLEMEARLKHIAQEIALLNAGSHSYLPDTPEASKIFEPHKWVLEAMRYSYLVGRSDGISDAISSIHKLAVT